MEAHINVSNLKCGSSEKSIARELKLFPEITEVNVDIEEALVEVVYDDSFPLDTIKAKLFSIGYPETRF